jgi:hypothetical protein
VILHLERGLVKVINIIIILFCVVMAKARKKNLYEKRKEINKNTEGSLFLRFLTFKP